MFVDDVSEVALWSEWGAEDHLEDLLPISTSLRVRIKSWLEEYTLHITERVVWSGEDNVDHDRRGFELCAEIQEELGSDFDIAYGFHTSQGTREPGG